MRVLFTHKCDSELAFNAHNRYFQCIESIIIKMEYTQDYHLSRLKFLCRLGRMKIITDEIKSKRFLWRNKGNI